MKLLPPPSNTPKKKLISFPHISRIFSAPAGSLLSRRTLWSILAAFIVTNVYAQANYDAIEWEKLIPMLGSPLAAATHLTLAHTLESEGRLSAAREEMLIAYDLGLPILGATTKHDDTESIPYWSGIASQYPTYRDAHLILGWLYYKQGNRTLAQTEIEAARTLDPANESTQRLLKLLGK